MQKHLVQWWAFSKHAIHVRCYYITSRISQTLTDHKSFARDSANRHCKNRTSIETWIVATKVYQSNFNRGKRRILKKHATVTLITAKTLLEMEHWLQLAKCFIYQERNWGIYLQHEQEQCVHMGYTSVAKIWFFKRPSSV